MCKVIKTTNVRSLVSPIHIHDCDTCLFLGTFRDHDLYFHENQSISNESTVIARYGDRGEYSSGLIFGYKDRHNLTSVLGEAFRRATNRGLIPLDYVPF
jgi:hypothetical protein